MYLLLPIDIIGSIVSFSFLMDLSVYKWEQMNEKICRCVRDFSYTYELSNRPKELMYIWANNEALTPQKTHTWTSTELAAVTVKKALGLKHITWY